MENPSVMASAAAFATTLRPRQMRSQNKSAYGRYATAQAWLP